MMHSRAMLLLMLLLPTTTIFASEEEYVAWSAVRIVSEERPETGRVVFDAKTAGERHEHVSIEAFGRSFQLSDRDLSRLQGFPLSSILITHEVGYPSVGGHTVYFKLKKLHYAGEAIVEDRVIVSVSREKGLRISERERRELKPADE